MENQPTRTWAYAAWYGVLTSLLCAALCSAQDSPPLYQPTDLAADSPGLVPAEEDVLDMDLDQLSRADVVVPVMDTVVSTVTRQESTVGRSPAAVFVITPEMIRRSGANNIPDVLRMVPGLDVAQIDANKWAISCRGFNEIYADKLLVQIDGRAVYTQTFSGVNWDAQDVPLQDIARIEVIRGPGATVWGANAVNGVINIITKNAEDTQGLLVSGGGGSQYREFGFVRYGGKIGNDFAWRVYGKQFDRELGNYPGEDQGFNDWEQARGGFRTDWEPSDCDVITIQGDFYDGPIGNDINETFSTAPYSRDELFNSQISGQNFLGRWTHTLDEDSDWALQAYYDHSIRDSSSSYEEQKIFDLDFQYHFLWNDIHNVVCGAGYRRNDDDTIGSFWAKFIPPSRVTNLFSYFIQDEITLEEDRWYIIAGSKFEHNEFSGFEFQPTVRLLFLPSERESMWAAVSRAVRTPNRTEENVLYHQALSPVAPVFVQVVGDESIAAEDLLAYELGYRAQPSDDFSWDVALFYNNYTNLIGVVSDGAPYFDPAIGGTIIPTKIANSLSGDTYGAELTSTYRINPRWEVTGAYTMLYMDIHAPVGDLIQGASPNNQVYLRSSWKPWCDVDIDLIGRYVDSLPSLGVPSYVTMDARFAWRPYENLEWAVVGRNLVDSPHEEFNDVYGGTIGSDVSAEVFTTLTWTR